MARWVPQSIRSSASNRARTRTAYLAPLVPEIDAEIQDYLAAHPNGEEVTLAVLRRVGRQRALAMCPNALDAVKQDIGLLTAIRLDDLFTPQRVLTFREDNGKRPSTRAATWPDLEWVSRFTPHRLLPAQAHDRIVLDTNVVRSFIQGDATALDFECLAKVRGGRPVSIADPAWAELVSQLHRRSIPFADWTARVRVLSRVLDSEWPIVPSGWEASALAGIEDLRGFDSSTARAYYAAVWNFMATATSASDFNRHRDYTYPSGQAFRLGPISGATLDAVFNARKARWLSFVQTMRKLSGGSPPGPELADEIRSSLGGGMHATAVDKLDLVVRALVALVAASITKPDDKLDLNDAIDIDVLFTASLPAVICTADGRMISTVQRSQSADAWRVKTPAQMLEWLGEAAGP